MSMFISLASLADVDPTAAIRSYSQPFTSDKVVQMALTVSSSNPGFDGLTVMDYVTRVTGSLSTDTYMAGYNAVEKKNKVVVEVPAAAPAKPIDGLIYTPEVIQVSSRTVAPEPVVTPISTPFTPFDAIPRPTPTPPTLVPPPPKPVSTPLTTLITSLPPQPAPSFPYPINMGGGKPITIPDTPETLLQKIERKTGLTTKQTTVAGISLLALAAVVGFVKGKSKNS